jgi:hypothetical protein
MDRKKVDSENEEEMKLCHVFVWNGMKDAVGL